MKPEGKKTQRPEKEPDYAKRLEKEMSWYGNVIESLRADGVPDKEIWETLESFG